VKVALIALLVGVAFGAGWYVRGVQDERALQPAATPLTQVERKALEATQHKCRDDCEERNILQKLGDEWLRNCRFACNGPPRPNEPIHSITVAPADHGKR
jgi:hypothetical protein